jgi:hypothetical protein
VSHGIDLFGRHLTLWQAALSLGTGVLLALFARRVLARWTATAGVRLAALGAVMCTGVSTNTSWRYFGDHLHVTDTIERALMFATAEVVLIGLALMTRENYRKPGSTGGGAPGVLVWVISGFACVPAFAEGGDLTGALVRAVLGPIFAALLWHLAMGVELTHTRSKDAPKGLLGRLAAHVREQLLAALGLAEPDRSARQILQDRAAERAVYLADVYAQLTDAQRCRRRGKRTARKLRDAVRESGAGTDPQRRTRLLAELAATRHALDLATTDLASPWHDTPPDTDTDTVATDTPQQADGHDGNRDAEPDTAPGDKSRNRHGHAPVSQHPDTLTGTVLPVAAALRNTPAARVTTRLPELDTPGNTAPTTDGPDAQPDSASASLGATHIGTPALDGHREPVPDTGTVATPAADTLARWSPDTARVARAIVAQWRADGVPVTSRSFFPELRRRGGTVASEHRTALYRYATGIDQAHTEDGADAAA